MIQEFMINMLFFFGIPVILFFIFVKLFLYLAKKNIQRQVANKQKKREIYFKNLKQLNPSYKKTLDDLLNNKLTTPNIINVYRELSPDIEYPILCQIIIALKNNKAFPKDVDDWLDDPYNFLSSDLTETMNEFIAIHEHRIDSRTAITAFGDGFLSLDEALKYIDKYRYPKTIELMKSDSYPDHDDLKESINEDEKEYNR